MPEHWQQVGDPTAHVVVRDAAWYRNRLRWTNVTFWILVVVAVIAGFVAYGVGFAAGAEAQCEALNQSAGFAVCG